MSRSNPNENGTPNPAVRWFEWNGEHGTIRYYDKEKKETIDVGSDFTFLLLDQVGSVRGWHDSSDSGIYSNEVKDTTQDVLVVKSFKGGTLAEGLYRDIKDRVGSMGGQFVANCYIAFKNGGGLAIGSIKFKGAALGAWMEFEKAHRNALYDGTITIHDYTEGKKGRVIFRVPGLKLTGVSPDAKATAIALDRRVQQFLAAYLRRNKREQVEASAHPVHHISDEEMAGVGVGGPAPITDDDIPF
jgi:hypothetical protein